MQWLGVKSCVLLLLLSAGLSSGFARGFHACANADGSVSYQQTPCDLGPATDIKALELASLDRQAVIETVALWDKAMKLKDPEALKRLISRQFQMIVRSGDERREDQRIGYATFVSRFLWAVPAMRDYDINRDQVSVKVQGDSAVHTSRAVETTAFLSKSARSSTIMCDIHMRLESKRLRMTQMVLYPAQSSR